LDSNEPINVEKEIETEVLNFVTSCRIPGPFEGPWCHYYDSMTLNIKRASTIRTA